MEAERGLSNGKKKPKKKHVAVTVYDYASVTRGNRT
jgi:hypothetical protein